MNNSGRIVIEVEEELSWIQERIDGERWPEVLKWAQAHVKDNNLAIKDAVEECFQLCVAHGLHVDRSNEESSSAK